MEVVREEIRNFKQDLEDLRKIIQGGHEPTEVVQRSYSEIVKDKKKENIIIIKSKVQESEVTKKLIKEKIDIKQVEMAITKMKKESNGAIIMGCKTEKELEKLKTTVQAKLGENFEVTESPRIKPKIKVVNIGEEEYKLDDDELTATIKRQNKIDAEKEGFHMRIVKRIIKEKRMIIIKIEE
ncbi:hypothetical protein ALC60_13470 [Trachymyrmex zeteki]|uniref:Uncharacterized protein n=1 Tax=Mycetomoellerius zeteki TaxID=64791 RepID=A0A151WI26_9HYME|nr:hypothetical protein ALC60_13470 [Trachymyrmex zeteki]